MNVSAVKRNALAVFAVLLMALVLCSCHNEYELVQGKWGSFTTERTESFDGKYYALQRKLESNVKVTVYSSASDAEVFSFVPARARDFYGICWESDSYNIWVQSGDTGVFRYQFQNGEWAKTESAERPADIVSKYDD